MAGCNQGVSSAEECQASESWCVTSVPVSPHKTFEGLHTYTQGTLTHAQEERGVPTIATSGEPPSIIPSLHSVTGRHAFTPTANQVFEGGNLRGGLWLSGGRSCVRTFVAPVTLRKYNDKMVECFKIIIIIYYIKKRKGFSPFEAFFPDETSDPKVACWSGWFLFPPASSRPPRVF